MTDADTFIAAIAQRWWDTLPRLVFADWLDDRGDSARAEFIRVQCRIEEMKRLYDRLSPLPPEHAAHGEWAALRRRGHELLVEHRRAWERELLLTDAMRVLGGFPFNQFPEQDILQVAEQLEYARGFPEGVTLAEAQLDRYGEYLFSRLPVNKLTIVYAPHREREGVIRAVPGTRPAMPVIDEPGFEGGNVWVRPVSLSQHAVLYSGRGERAGNFFRLGAVEREYERCEWTHRVRRTALDVTNLQGGFLNRLPRSIVWYYPVVVVIFRPPGPTPAGSSKSAP